MDYLSIKNWDKYQHYKDRNPPWIKLHHSLLDDYEFSCLQDASKLLLMILYMLASRTENKIPADPEWIRQKGMLKTKPDFTELLVVGFIDKFDDAGNLLADCLQDASKVLDQRQRQRQRQRQSRGRDIYVHFDTFWTLYPKKKSKSDAEKAWAKIRDSEKIIERIEKALEWQIKSFDWTKENGQYIPLPATYLNGRRWEDEPQRKRIEERNIFTFPNTPEGDEAFKEAYGDKSND